MRHNAKSGFTLIELIIVIVIIGILASIAAPMMQGMKAKAICTEAVTGMSAIRTALRSYYAEHGIYPFSNGSANPVTDCDPNLFPGLNLRGRGTTSGTSSLDGVYFSEECYIVAVNSAGTTTMGVMGCNFTTADNQAAKHAESASIADSDRHGDSGILYLGLIHGRLNQVYLSRTGYPEGSITHPEATDQ